MATHTKVPEISTRTCRGKLKSKFPMYVSDNQSCRGFVGIKYVDEVPRVCAYEFPVYLLVINFKIVVDANYKLEWFGLVTDRLNSMCS